MKSTIESNETFGMTLWKDETVSRKQVFWNLLSKGFVIIEFKDFTVIFRRFRLSLDRKDILETTECRCFENETGIPQRSIGFIFRTWKDIGKETTTINKWDILDEKEKMNQLISFLTVHKRHFTGLFIKSKRPVYHRQRWWVETITSHTEYPVWNNWRLDFPFFFYVWFIFTFVVGSIFIVTSIYNYLLGKSHHYSHIEGESLLDVFL